MKGIKNLKSSKCQSGGIARDPLILNTSLYPIPNTTEAWMPLDVFEKLMKNNKNIPKKESISDIVKRFDMKPLKVIPYKELTKEEIVESDKRFIKKLIQIFEDVKNKIKI